MFSKLTEAQKQFFETGRTRDLAFRICQLQLLADAMRKNETVLEEALKKDLGKSAFESYATEIGFVLADIRYTIQNLQKWSAPKRVRTPLYLFPGKSKIQKEPYGSVLILGPYNYPVQLLAEPLIGAIAAGNCAVLKPSELTPHVSKAMYQIVHSTFKEEYIACVEGGVEVNQELLSQKFDYIFFTGSERVGRIVMKADRNDAAALGVRWKKSGYYRKNCKYKRGGKKNCVGKTHECGTDLCGAGLCACG